VPLSLAPTLLYSHDTGVSPTRTRRRFTTAFKLQMLEAAAQCTKPGELGALLRREGLYSSHLAAWRAAATNGTLVARRGSAPRAQAEAVGSQREADRAARAPAQARHGPGRALGPHRRASKKSSAAPRPRTAGERRFARDTVMAVLGEHGTRCGIGARSTALGLPPATYYRVQKTLMRAAAGDLPPVAPRASPARTLRPEERAQVLTVLHEPRFLDLAPAEVFATLLDEGTLSLLGAHDVPASSRRRAKPGNDGRSGAIRTTPHPSCWRPRRISCGVGI